MKKDRTESIVLAIVLILASVTGIVVSLLTVDLLPQKIVLSLILTMTMSFGVTILLDIATAIRDDREEALPYDPVQGNGKISKKTRDIMARNLETFSDY